MGNTDMIVSEHFLNNSLSIMCEESNQPQIVYGSIDSDNNFVPLPEREMVAQSLEALDDLQKTGNSISQKTMESWVESLGIDQQLR